MKKKKKKNKNNNKKKKNKTINTQDSYDEKEEERPNPQNKLEKRRKRAMEKKLKRGGMIGGERGTERDRDSFSGRQLSLNLQPREEEDQERLRNQLALC